MNLKNVLVINSYLILKYVIFVITLIYGIQKNVKLHQSTVNLNLCLQEKMFENPFLVFKDGQIIVKNGTIKKVINGKLYIAEVFYV